MLSNENDFVQYYIETGVLKVVSFMLMSTHSNVS